MKTNKTIGLLFIIGAVSLFIPYTLLIFLFEYPDILRLDPGAILTRFHKGGTPLILTWLAFALTGLPLLPAYILLGKKMEGKSIWAGVATKIGVIGLIVQMIGLLRWTFVVPVLANTYVNSSNEGIKNAIEVSFITLHQFAGVLLGEHLGQLFIIIWTVMITYSFSTLKLFPKWVNLMAYVSSFIYLLSQLELLSTVIPSVPVWGLAGFLGSTLWLIWLICIGVLLIKGNSPAD